MTVPEIKISIPVYQMFILHEKVPSLEGINFGQKGHKRNYKRLVLSINMDHFKGLDSNKPLNSLLTPFF